MKFDLVIIDSNIASGIQPRKLGLIMASRDPVAIDVAAAQIAWLNPNQIPYFRLAETEGVGSRAFIRKGESLESFKALYPKKTFRRKVWAELTKWCCRLGLADSLGLE